MGRAEDEEVVKKCSCSSTSAFALWCWFKRQAVRLWYVVRPTTNILVLKLCLGIFNGMVLLMTILKTCQFSD
jgi:hypothetical protein